MKRIEDLEEEKEAKAENAIVLSGGGAKGFAHIGVLKALNEKGIFPEIVSGTSAGALVGSLYADGYTPDDIYEIFQGKDLYKLVQIILPRQGLFKMKDLITILKTHLKARRIEELKLETFICCTNFTIGRVRYFYEGPIIKPIVASASIPVLFQPIKINEELYVDGGMFQNLPVEPVLGKARRIIGVHVNPFGRLREDETGLISTVERVFQLGTRANVLQNINECDWFIEPPKLKDFGMLNVKLGEEMYHIGYEYTMEYLEKKGF